jgi:hypothetical protein
MNETEARTKRCPILRLIPLAANQEITVNQFPRCVASDCMMWRVSYVESDDGFCGLAGGTGSASMGYPPDSLPPSSLPPPATSPPLPPQTTPSRTGPLPRR